VIGAPLRPAVLSPADAHPADRR